MYFQHFGLEQYPFTLTPDTEFFLEYGEFKDALDVVECALYTGEGFTKLTGEVGTGKTLLCRKLMNSLDSRFVTAFIPNPSLNPLALHSALAKELGVNNGANYGLPRLLEIIKGRLLALHAEEKQVVLLMDEAQALPEENMETLLLYSNMETEKCKLLQLVLFGQPELDVRLNQSHLRQLRQRILFSYRIKPLTADALSVYVQHRLHVAGYRGLPLFSSDALVLLHRGSGGVPRLVNVLAHKAMLVAFGRHENVIHALHVRKAIADTEGVKIQKRTLTTVFSRLRSPASASL